MMEQKTHIKHSINEIKVWFFNWQSSGKLDQGNKRSGKNIYPNHTLSLQDKGKVLTICKKTTIFLRKKYGMERLFW